MKTKANINQNRKPTQIAVLDYAAEALLMAASLVKQGYTIDDLSVTLFTNSGQIAFTMVPGDLPAHSVAAAAAALEQALEIEMHREGEATDRAAEEAARAQVKANIAAEIAEKEKALLKLKQSLSAV